LVMHSNAGLLTPGARPADPATYEMEHYRDKLYRSGDGGLVIPARAIKKCLINGCKFITDKPKGLGFKSYGPLVEAVLLVNDDALLSTTLDEVVPWTAVVNLDPSKGPKGPRGPRTRPLCRIPWTAVVSVTVMDGAIPLDVLAQIARKAGTRCGLLDGRAIDMGRCHITVREESAR